jgi:hypothetical protein
MSFKIAAYSLQWQIKNNVGVVFLKNDQGSSAKFELNSMEEFTAVSYILRNTKDVTFDATNQSLTMEWTPPGP